MQTKNQATAGEEYSVSAGYRLQHSYFLLELLEAVRAKTIEADDCLLDVGCGPGCIIDPLWNDKFRPGKVVAVDDDRPNDLSSSWTNGRARHFVRQDIHAWEPATNMPHDFSIVYSAAALHWVLRDPKTEAPFYKKMFRVLKPGGYFVATFPGATDFYPTFTTLLVQAFKNLGHRFGSNQREYWHHRDKHVRMFNTCSDALAVPCNEAVGFKKIVLLRAIEWETWRRNHVVDMWMSAGHSIFRDEVDLNQLKRELESIVESDAALKQLGIPVWSDASGDYLTPYSYRFYMILQKPSPNDKEDSRSFIHSCDPSLPILGFSEASKTKLRFGDSRSVGFDWDGKTVRDAGGQSVDDNRVVPLERLAKHLARRFVYSIYLVTDTDPDDRRWITLHSRQYERCKQWQFKNPLLVKKTFTSIEHDLEDKDPPLHSLSMLLTSQQDVIQDIASNRLEYGGMTTLTPMWIISDRIREDQASPPDSQDAYLEILSRIGFGEKLSLFYLDDRLGEVIDREWRHSTDPCGIELVRYLRWQGSVQYPQLFILSFTNAGGPSGQTAKRYSAAVSLNPFTRSSAGDIAIVAGYLKALSLWREVAASEDIGYSKGEYTISHELDTPVGILDMERERLTEDGQFALDYLELWRRFVKREWSDELPSGLESAFRTNGRFFERAFLLAYMRSSFRNLLPKRKTKTGQKICSRSEVLRHLDQWLDLDVSIPDCIQTGGTRWLFQARCWLMFFTIGGIHHAIEHAFRHVPAFENWASAKGIRKAGLTVSYEQGDNQLVLRVQDATDDSEPVKPVQVPYLSAIRSNSFGDIRLPPVDGFAVTISPFKMNGKDAEGRAVWCATVTAERERTTP
jgi:SAM-dependent methyltransferase